MPNDRPVNARTRAANPTDLTPRLLAAAGFVTAAVLVLNALKRAGLLETSTPLQLLAPVAQLFAVAFVIGVALLARPATRRLMTLAAVLSATSFAAVTGVEFVLNLVFPYVDAATVDALRAGPLGPALLGASVLFLVGAVVFAIAVLRDGQAPRIPTVLYAVSAAPVAFRFLLSDAVLPVALAGLVVSITWLAVWAVRRRPGLGADTGAGPIGRG